MTNADSPKDAETADTPEHQPEANNTKTDAGEGTRKKLPGKRVLVCLSAVIGVVGLLLVLFIFVIPLGLDGEEDDTHEGRRVLILSAPAGYEPGSPPMLTFVLSGGKTKEVAVPPSGRAPIPFGAKIVEGRARLHVGVRAEIDESSEPFQLALPPLMKVNVLCSTANESLMNMRIRVLERIAGDDEERWLETVAATKLPTDWYRSDSSGECHITDLLPGGWYRAEYRVDGEQPFEFTFEGKRSVAIAHRLPVFEHKDWIAGQVQPPEDRGQLAFELGKLTLMPWSFAPAVGNQAIRRESLASRPIALHHDGHFLIKARPAQEIQLDAALALGSKSVFGRGVIAFPTGGVLALETPIQLTEAQQIPAIVERDGKALAMAAVFVRFDGERLSTQADRNGALMLEVRPNTEPVGEVFCRVQVPNEPPQELNITQGLRDAIVSGGTLRIELPRLEPGKLMLQLEGSYGDATQIYLMPLGTLGNAVRRIPVRGSFYSYEGLPGRYRLQAVSGDAISRIYLVDLKEGEEKVQPIDLRTGAILTIEYSHGPYQQATLNLESSSGVRMLVPVGEGAVYNRTHPDNSKGPTTPQARHLTIEQVVPAGEEFVLKASFVGRAAEKIRLGPLSVDAQKAIDIADYD